MPTLVNVTAGLVVSPGSSFDFTIPSTGAGHCLVVVVQGENGTGTAAVTGMLLGGAADNFAQIKAVENADTGTGIWTDVVVWLDPGCAGSQTDVTINLNANWATATSVDVTVFEVDFSSATVVLDKSSTGTGTGLAYSSGTTATTTAAAEFWVGAAYAISGLSLPASGWTDGGINAQDGNAGCGSHITTATGTAVYNGAAASGTVEDWAALVVTLKAGGGATPGTPNRLAPVLPKARAPRRAVLVRVTAAVARGKPNRPAPVLPRAQAPRPRAVVIRTVGTAPAFTPPGTANRLAPVLPRPRQHPRAVLIRTAGTAPAFTPPGIPNRPAPVLPRIRTVKRAVIIHNPIVIPVGPVTPPVPASGSDTVHPWRKHPWPRTPIGIPLIDLASALTGAGEILPPDPASLAPDHDAGAGTDLAEAPDGPGITERARTAIAAAAAAAARNIPDSGALSSPEVGDAIAYWQQQRIKRRR